VESQLFGGIALFLRARPETYFLHGFVDRSLLNPVLGHEQTYGQYWHDVRLTPESVGGTASTPTACCYKRWDFLTNRCRLRIQTAGYPPLPTVRAMLSMQGALSSVR
jgi:hypothetical protein